MHIKCLGPNYCPRHRIDSKHILIRCARWWEVNETRQSIPSSDSCVWFTESKENTNYTDCVGMFFDNYCFNFTLHYDLMLINLFTLCTINYETSFRSFLRELSAFLPLLLLMYLLISSPVENVDTWISLLFYLLGITTGNVSNVDCWFDQNIRRVSTSFLYLSS